MTDGGRKEEKMGRRESKQGHETQTDGSAYATTSMALLAFKVPCRGRSSSSSLHPCPSVYFLYKVMWSWWCHLWLLRP